jgi:hypothetical protein
MVQAALVALTCAATQGAAAADAQIATPARHFARVLTADAYYEYNGDGVPVLGLVTGQLAGDRVKFTTCTDVTVEVEFKRLRKSEATCSTRGREPGPWAENGSGIVPLVKASASSPTVVRLKKQSIDLWSVPGVREALTGAKAGDLVGYAFTEESGGKSLVILDPNANREWKR